MLYDHKDNDPVKVLTEDESWQLLERAAYGRLATYAAGVLDVVPINVKAVGHKLLIRTTPGTKLAEVVIGGKVAFEADAVLDGEAWSVVVKGNARILEHRWEIESAEQAGLETWLPALKNVYVEIQPSRVEGRHFLLGSDPEA
ncbi:pyridoxamine 5'-phosphate oxidase family protein [Sinomonas sp. JGH33]|uniref:Pyridoxamine 5'-phosphate oxidase family protein n=1 Tax=Sinomonas terricola TaxID=3110330 RepID=A0ABU5T360_9MICC|nr:pyridoxamine 5'-phosphate oxidase family protein [Sinomonas sp. JGH33]MEA5454096.1 pyridoxamine 5'-phosphate oxidase family protein [Sinomonas sp. JGH33]